MTRENQGLKIALIVFVMLTVVLSVTTYIYFDNFRNEREKAAKSAGDSAAANLKASDYKRESEKFRRMMGAETKGPQDPNREPEPVEVEKTFRERLQLLGVALPGVLPTGVQEKDVRDFQTLTKLLHTAVVSTKIELAKVVADRDVLAAKNGEDLARLTAESATHKAAADKNAADLAEERTKFNEARNKFATETQDLSKQLADARTEITNLSTQKTNEAKTLGAQIATLTQTNKNLNDRLQRLTHVSIDRADGKVTWVSQRERVVYLNLGSADLLQRQTTFSIYGVDESNLSADRRKGSIEVTRILDRHLAEARILDDQRSDPILPGDQAYSPVWHPGLPMRFALCGFMDIDDNGKSDRQKIKDLIARNGGVIDAEVDDEGKRTGAISIETKFLVMGVRPTENTTKEFLDAYSSLIRDADRWGIRKINVQEFLDMLGYQPDDRSVSLGKGANPKDFPAKPAGGKAPVSTGSDLGNSFKKRTPPGEEKKDAQQP